MVKADVKIIILALDSPRIFLLTKFDLGMCMVICVINCCNVVNY